MPISLSYPNLAPTQFETLVHSGHSLQNLVVRANHLLSSFNWQDRRDWIFRVLIFLKLGMAVRINLKL